MYLSNRVWKVRAVITCDFLNGVNIPDSMINAEIYHRFCVARVSNLVQAYLESTVCDSLHQNSNNGNYFRCRGTKLVKMQVPRLPVGSLHSSSLYRKWTTCSLRIQTPS